MSTIAPSVGTSVIQPAAPLRKKMTTAMLRQKKARAEIITMLTAYDYPTALAEDQAGIDCILVGDSLGMVVLGYQNTLPVTMDEMLHHSAPWLAGPSWRCSLGTCPSCRIKPPPSRRYATPDVSCRRAAWRRSNSKAGENGLTLYEPLPVQAFP